MNKNYDHALIEPSCQKLWDAVVDVYDQSRPTFSIVLAPPNSNNQLHLGHALNGTINDVLKRYYHLKGYNTVFIPGTDHAGLSTELAVTKKLLKEGKNKNTMTRTEFLKEVDEWAKIL